MKNALYDENFLLALEAKNERTVWARVTCLTALEEPIEYIEGKVTGGSINIDGASAVRRSFNMTMIAKDVNINDFYWGLKTKVKVEIGLSNTIDSTYPEIIWFKQGIFILTSFSTALSTNNYTISLGGKDKMCLLNGDVAGSLPHSTDFGAEDIYDSTTGITTRHKIPIKTIIKEAVHHFGNELWQNIIINDLDDWGLRVLEYRGNQPLYLFRNIDSGVFIQMTMNEDQSCYYAESNVEVKVNHIPVYDNLFNEQNGLINQATRVKLSLAADANTYTVAKLEYGSLAGNEVIDLVYPDDLIANVGESITSVLDKLVQMLGPFEYFYDVDGRFVFQRKKNFISTDWNGISTDGLGEIYADSGVNDHTVYNFQGSTLVTSFNNAPNLLNLRNDFSVWGVKKSQSGGSDIPIHMRYAIDKKPEYYVTFDNKAYMASDNNERGIKLFYTFLGNEYEEGEEDRLVEDCHIEMRRLAKLNGSTSLKENAFDDWGLDVLLKTKAFNITVASTGELIAISVPFPTPKMHSAYLHDWRELIYQMALDYRRYNHNLGMSTTGEGNGDEFFLELSDRNPQYPNGKTGYEQYYTDIEGFWRLLYDPNPDDASKYDSATYWNYDVSKDPASLIFWIDFLDVDTDLGQYSVQAIGDRPKSINDNKVTAIYYQETPTVIFTTEAEYNSSDVKTGYTYIWLQPHMKNLFTITSKGKSAKEQVDQMLYDYSYCTESATIVTVPIYRLDPNTRIYVRDDNSGINGQYIISKITIPLAYNGTMNITATKAVESII